MKRILLLALVAGAIVQTGCKKDTSPAINHGSIAVTVYHQVDGDPLVFDTVKYTNASLNVYGVERLQYYLSDFKLFRKGVQYYSGSEIVPVDASVGNGISFNITPPNGLEPGNYDSIAFIIGIDSAHNISYSLPQNLDNLDMGWPDVMGGGYHFFKLEGHYQYNGGLAGFAMHLGTNGYQVSVGIPCNIQVQGVGDAPLKMTMNVNEWFKNPANYDFTTDGVYSMGNATLMHKLALNGADVFTAN